jgi:hypothetical protein
MTKAHTIVREARKDDLVSLISMFAVDDIGGHLDALAPEAFGDYVKAFDTIAASPVQTLYVAERDGEVVGTFQTSVATTLSRRGASFMISKRRRRVAICAASELVRKWLNSSLPRQKAAVSAECR